MHRSWYRGEKPSQAILWKSFFEVTIFCTVFGCLQKKLFHKITWLSFSPLYHALCIFSTCCNYVLCSLHPGESTGDNESITQHLKNILTQEKGIFSVWSKSNVDEAQIYVEISTFFWHGTQLQIGSEFFWWVLWHVIYIKKLPLDGGMTLVKNHDHTIRRSKVILLDNKNTHFNGRFAAHCSGWTHIETGAQARPPRGHPAKTKTL